MGTVVSSPATEPMEGDLGRDIASGQVTWNPLFVSRCVKSTSFSFACPAFPCNLLLSVLRSGTALLSLVPGMPSKAPDANKDEWNGPEF